MTAQQTTAEHWGAMAEGDSPFCGTQWLCSPHVLADYVWTYFGGQDWFSWLRDRYCRPARADVLSLCCGVGDAERTFLRAGAFERVVGIDLSERVVEKGRQESQAAGMTGLEFVRGDVNTLNLEANSFDLVLSWMAMHHVRELEHVYEQAAQALRPGGILVLNEYIGAPRFAFPPAQVRLMDHWLAALPEELRRWPTGELRTMTAPDPRIVEAEDPSEAIRSDEIIPRLGQRFNIIDRVDYGGGLLHFLLGGSVQCFAESNPIHMGWLDRLYDAERAAMARGEIGSDFTLLVAEPKR